MNKNTAQAQDLTYYRLSGVDHDGKPFVRTSTNLAYLRCINAWKARMYMVKDGKPRLMWAIHN